jgi:hypothetical protein
VTLEQVIRRTVAEALAASEPVSTEPAEDDVSYVPQPAEVWEQPAPTADVPDEQPTSIFAERQVGNGAAQPVQSVQPAQPALNPARSEDEKRRAFVRSFLNDQRAVRGLAPN